MQAFPENRERENSNSLNQYYLIPKPENIIRKVNYILISFKKQEQKSWIRH